MTSWLSTSLTTKLLSDNRLVYNCMYIQAGTSRCANTNAHDLSSMCSYDEETHLHDILSCVQWYNQWLFASMWDSAVKTQWCEWWMSPQQSRDSRVCCAALKPKGYKCHFNWLYTREPIYSTYPSLLIEFSSVQFNFGRFPFNIRCSRSHQVL